MGTQPGSLVETVILLVGLAALLGWVVVVGGDVTGWWPNRDVILMREIEDCGAGVMLCKFLWLLYPEAESITTTAGGHNQA